MSVPRHKLYTQHSRHWRDNRYVYPVISRRSGGLSIGINLNPDKKCNFDCIYCSVDRSTPPLVAHVDLEVLRAELDHMLDLATSGRLFSEPPFDTTPPPLRRLNDVAFSGDGEPTSYRQLGEACRIVADLLSQYRANDTRIILITNATLLDRPGVAEAVRFLDAHNGAIWAKLDAGTADYYRVIDRSAVPLQRVLDNILAVGRDRPIVIQSMFMNVDGQPPTDVEIDAYLQRLGDLRDGGCRIKLVQVYTIARQTAENYVRPLSDAEIDAITARVRSAGFEAAPFYAPAQG